MENIEKIENIKNIVKIGYFQYFLKKSNIFNVFKNSTIFSNPEYNLVTEYYLSALAGIIWPCGAASITDCQVFVDSGMTKPKPKYHSATSIVCSYCYCCKIRSLGKICCHRKCR